MAVRYQQTMWASAAVLLTMPACHLHAQAAASPSGSSTAVAAQRPKTVALTSDGCATVADGDVVTLQWNPGFSRPLEISGLHDLTLIFARPSHPKGKGPIPSGEFALRALPVKISPEIPVPVADAHNGFLLFSFRAHLAGIEAGQYNLVYAAATPELSSDPQETPPEMTNSPLRYPFCLNVAANPLRKKGP